MDRNNTKNTLFHWYDFRLRIIMQSIVISFFVGLVIVLYRYAIEKALVFSRSIDLLEHRLLWLIPLCYSDSNGGWLHHWLDYTSAFVFLTFYRLYTILFQQEKRPIGSPSCRIISMCNVPRSLTPREVFILLAPYEG